MIPCHLASQVSWVIRTADDDDDDNNDKEDFSLFRDFYFHLLGIKRRILYDCKWWNGKDEERFPNVRVAVHSHLAMPVLRWYGALLRLNLYAFFTFHFTFILK
jgi:hypothetical protein